MGCGGLVPDIHDPDPLLEAGVIDRIQMIPAEAEDPINPFLLEGLDQKLCTADRCHRSPP